MDFEPKDPRLFFYEAIQQASDRLRLRIESWTEFYLVDLLVRQVYSKVSLDPFVTQVTLATEAHPKDKFKLWKGAGESALIQVGMFPEHIEKKGVTRSYVAQIGGRAYLIASTLATDGMGTVYKTVAGDFGSFAALLRSTRKQTVIHSGREK